MPVAVEILDLESDLESFRSQWDALAVETGQPYSSPAWMLAWWRHARPADALLRAVVVVEGERLIGLAPLWVAGDRAGGTRYAMLASRLSPPVRPLAATGRENEVAAAIASALARSTPRPHALQLEDESDSTQWAMSLADAWPGRRPWRYSPAAMAAPAIVLGGLDYDAWLQGRNAKFRQETRRRRRQLDKAGGRFSLAGENDFDSALAAFLRLHRDRWDYRGGSNALVDGIEPMLAEAGRELLPSERFRLFTIDVDGEVICAHVFIAAGSEVSGWNGGFDASWSRYGPSILTMLEAVADAAQRGERRISLGPGDQPYKGTLADERSEISLTTLVPRGAAYPLARARLAPYQARGELAKRLSPEAKRRVRGLVRR
ncbi:MAG TPA: GNAT family N-acetyltransferase [Thermoleophilaceae bacterium]|nr:GNAT family N-acetyltransferase [Thermoleophilaceae bacterium]